ncbi:MAG: hypothetical protein Kow0079_09970 [Vicingaceae bacterium]
MLYFLGYDELLKWSQYGNDGIYGEATTSALFNFYQQNLLSGDGSEVNALHFDTLHNRFNMVDDLIRIHHLVTDDKIVKKLFYKSTNSNEIKSLQIVLNNLGYGDLLQWEKYHADGDYGNATATAVKQFAIDNGLSGVDGKKVNKKTGLKLIENAAKLLGKNWLKNYPLIEKENNDKHPLVTFTASHFIGKAQVHKDFVPLLNDVNEMAKKQKVKVWVTSSFRETSKVNGAIVTPAKFSNHMVGHAIDFNLKYGADFTKLCNSSCLSKNPLSQPVKGFIEAVRKHPKLRWGGDFSAKDVVHIDDHYNKDLETWKKTYYEIQSLA